MIFILNSNDPIIEDVGNDDDDTTTIVDGAATRRNRNNRENNNNNEEDDLVGILVLEEINIFFKSVISQWILLDFKIDATKDDKIKFFELERNTQTRRTKDF